MASSSQSLCSWPPSPALMSFHILSRSVLILTNAIGIGLCFASGADSSEPSGFIGGSFMSFSILIEPLFIYWNVRQMRRGDNKTSPFYKRTSGYERLETNDRDTQTQQLPGTKMLKFANLLDAVGFLAYIIVFGFAIRDATHYNWWYNRDIDMLMSYASVSILVCAVVHALLLLTQSAQLWSIRSRRRLSDMRCPHCKHRMGSMTSLHTNSSGSDQGRIASETSLVRGERQVMREQEQNLLGHDLVDADADAVPIADMSPGQVTGTCQVTPRASESSRPRAESSVTANETGEGENDRLIEKSK